MEGTSSTTTGAVRLAVYWGETLLDVSQVKDPRQLTAGDVFGAGISAAGVSPQLRLFSDEVSDKARLQLGPLTLIAEPVTPAGRAPRFSMPEDWTFFKVATMTGLAMAAVLVTIALTPQDLPNTDDDIISGVVKIFAVPPTPKPLPPSMAAAIAKAKGPEGKAGEKKAPKNQSPKETLMQKPGPDVSELGVLGAAKGSFFKDLVKSNTTSQMDAALAGLKNDSKNLGNATGFEGMAARHDNEGGGGTEWTQIGGVGTKGKCKGSKCGSNPNGLEFGEGKKVAVIPPSGPRQIIGGLSKEEIARVVRRHQSEIRYCYETELQKNPSLRGKVAVQFVIDPVGGVSEANVAESTMNNETAERCILGKIRNWKFPEPEGGGVVTVTYPWVFTTAGDDADE